LVALQVELRAAEMPGQPLGEIEGARPTDIMVEVIVELGLKARVGLRRVIGGLDREDQRHQGLGDKTSAIEPEMTARIRPAAKGVRCLHLRPFKPLSRTAGEGGARAAGAGG